MKNQPELYVSILRFGLLPILTICLTGCVHTQVLRADSADEVTEINRRAEQNTASLTLAAHESLPARSFRIGPEVVSWINPQSGEAQSAPVADLTSVQFTSHGQGALDGLGIGFASGALAGALLGLVTVPCTAPPCSLGPTENAMFGAILIGVPSALVGGVLGLARGRQTVYEVPALGPSPADRTRFGGGIEVGAYRVDSISGLVVGVPLAYRMGSLYVGIRPEVVTDFGYLDGRYDPQTFPTGPACRDTSTGENVDLALCSRYYSEFSASVEGGYYFFPDQPVGFLIGGGYRNQSGSGPFATARLLLSEGPLRVTIRGSAGTDWLEFSIGLVTGY